jgi:hypothetical protein
MKFCRLAQVILVASVVGAALPIGNQSAYADNTCNGGSKCNLEAQSNPSVSWPQGVSASFPTVGGPVATVIVNSIAVLAGNLSGDQAEVGWRLWAGANRFEPFSVSVYDGVYSAYPATRPAGNFTFSYSVRYHSAADCSHGFDCFEATAVSGGTTFMDNQMLSPSFITGYALTNAERHDATDAFSGTPTFTSLQRLSSSAWSSWPAAECFANNDPKYRNNYFTNPTKVTVTTGVTC